ncbi:MAG TPA: hypothetical protein VGG61_00265 [Gemmataceae bacterium]
MLAALEWQNMTNYTYLAISGGVIVALATGLYATPGGRLKVPGIVLSIIGSLGLGLGLGVILMGGIGYHWEKEQQPPMSFRTPDIGVAGPPPGAGARQGPGSGANKAQLAALVGKLDLLTEKPLSIQFSDEQRKDVTELLKGLADADDLSDEDAKMKVEKLHNLLEEQRGTLEAAGYSWSGQRGGPGRGAANGELPANPFKADQNAGHLKRLTDRVAQGAKERSIP